MSYSEISSGTADGNILKRKSSKERCGLNVRFASKDSWHYLPDYGLKNAFALFMVVLIPNLVMVLTFTVVHCQSSFSTLFDFLISNPLNVIFSSIWFQRDIHFLFGFSVIIGYMIFALTLMVVVPGSLVQGPMTPKGNVPEYKDNGFRCYLITLFSFATLAYLLPLYTPYSVSLVYSRLPTIFYCSNIISILFCLLLYFKGVYFPSSSDYGSSGYFFFDFYWGMELHPRIKGVDLKIFTNCRYGMTVWSLLILCYLTNSLETSGVHGGQIVNAVLQLLYITKFFWWEAGYYSTIDIMLDRAGFYICWGCLAFLPCMYTLSSYYMASVSVITSPVIYISALVMGIFSLIINYWADYQKQIFRSLKGNCMIWGQPPRIIEAYYTKEDGSRQKSLLLVSGFWGLARHFHYLPELSLAFSWCAASGFHHLLPFTYFIFLVILLLHRVERDDQKCAAKYGDYYSSYKKMVSYKIIPYFY